MDILTMIKKDHDEALAMIAALDERAEQKPSAKTEKMVRELVTAVKLHAKSEEAALYAALEGADEKLRAFCLEGYNEHELLDIMLDKLLVLPAGEDGELKAGLKVCKDLIEHHGKDEEEGKVFPKLKDAFSKEELVDMAGIMASEKERLAPAVEAEIDEASAGPRSRPTKPIKKKASANSGKSNGANAG